MYTVIKYLEAEEKPDEELRQRSQSLGDFPLMRPSRWPSVETLPHLPINNLGTAENLLLFFFLSFFF